MMFLVVMDLVYSVNKSCESLKGMVVTLSL